MAAPLNRAARTQISLRNLLISQAVRPAIDVSGVGVTTGLALGSPGICVQAAVAAYTRALQRLAWALYEHGAALLSRGEGGGASGWLDLPDEVLVQGTAHEAWEAQYHEAQTRARELLEDEAKDKATRRTAGSTVARSRR